MPAQGSAGFTWLAKLAPTCVSPLMLRSQPPVPEQAPLQPMNCIPVAGIASRCTLLPTVAGRAQFPAQLIPSGEVTIPCPVTAMFRVAVAATSSLPGDDFPPQAKSIPRIQTPQYPIFISPPPP